MVPTIRNADGFIEIIGHYDDVACCAKMTLLAQLYAIEYRDGYAKFKVDDEDKLKAVNDDLSFPVRYDLSIDGVTVGTSTSPWGAEVISTGVMNNGDIVIYTYEGSGTFLGLSTTSGASTPTYGIGDSININTAGTMALYSVASSAPAPSAGLFVGTLPLSKVFLGSTEVSKIYYGSTLLYESSGGGGGGDVPSFLDGLTEIVGPNIPLPVETGEPVAEFRVFVDLPEEFNTASGIWQISNEDSLLDSTHNVSVSYAYGEFTAPYEMRIYRADGTELNGDYNYNDWPGYYVECIYDNCTVSEGETLYVVAHAFYYI